MLSRIGLEGMEFYAAIGYYAQERMVRGRFTVDLEITVDTGIAAKRDDLSATVNYEKVYALCAACMKKEYDLIETVAQKIGETVKSEWPDIKEVKVCVSKWNPPLAGPISRTFAEIKIDES